MKRSVELLSRETTRIDFKFQTASSLTVHMFEWFSHVQQATLTFLHPYFAMSKLKYCMKDRQKPFSEFQQTTAVETFDNFRYKSFLKSCLYSTWFMFIEFVFKLVSGSLFFFTCSRIKNTRRKPFESSDRKCVLTENKQAWITRVCHIINYLLT